MSTGISCCPFCGAGHWSWCSFNDSTSASYDVCHTDTRISFFLYSLCFPCIQLSFFDIDCPIRKPFAKTLWQKKERRDKSQGNFSIENYYALQDAWWCLSLSLSCVYTDSIELFWGLCVCVYNCGSKADGMRIHQLAALQLCRPRLECFFPFFLFELKILIFHHHRVIKLERNASLFPP